jgi:nucleoside-diphosphate-sugar epimerase
MKVVVTGGAGFLGQQLAKALLGRKTLTGPSGRPEEIDSLVLFDAVPAERPAWADRRVETVSGDITDRESVLAFCDRDDLSVFHMASVMSGGGEADFDLAMRVNLEGGRNVLEALRARAGMPRLVFTSALSVFGGDAAQESVGDRTKHTPQTTYGVTKAILELLVNDYTRKGFLDGRSPRLPTVIVRPGVPNAAASSFASSVVREPLQGIDVVVPVPGSTTMAVIGHRAVIACLVAIHELDGAKLGHDRAVELPSISVTVDELVESLHRVAGDRPLGAVTIEPDPAIERIVATWPTHTSFERATALGFPADSEVDFIVSSFIEDFTD